MSKLHRVPDERSDSIEIEQLEQQLDAWRVPTKSASGLRLSTIGRVRLMRNQAVEIVAGMRAEVARLRRLVEEHEREEKR